MTDDGQNQGRAATAGAWISFRQQTWLLAVSGRWLLWIVGLGALRLLVALIDPGVPPLLITGLLPVIAAVAWAVLVWRRESPHRRSYHWSLPVSRPVHDLARVLAGASFVLVAGALWAGLEVVLASHGGLTHRSLTPDFELWARLALAPLIAYLLATPVVLWGDYPITRWLLGAFMCSGVLIAILDLRGIDFLSQIARRVGEARGAGLGNALTPVFALEMGDGSASWAAVPVWLAVGAVLTMFAAWFRPGDLRRRFRRPGARTAA